jgi:hypothetical protein
MAKVEAKISISQGVGRTSSLYRLKQEKCNSRCLNGNSAAHSNRVSLGFTPYNKAQPNSGGLGEKFKNQVTPGYMNRYPGRRSDILELFSWVPDRNTDICLPRCFENVQVFTLYHGLGFLKLA